MKVSNVLKDVDAAKLQRFYETAKKKGRKMLLCVGSALSAPLRENKKTVSAREEKHVSARLKSFVSYKPFSRRAAEIITSSLWRTKRQPLPSLRRGGVRGGVSNLPTQ